MRRSSSIIRVVPLLLTTEVEILKKNKKNIWTWKDVIRPIITNFSEARGLRTVISTRNSDFRRNDNGNANYFRFEINNNKKNLLNRKNKFL